MIRIMKAVAAADQQRIHVHGKCLHQALLGGVLHFGGGGGVRTGTLPRFVRVDAPFYTPAYRGPEARHRCECIVKNQAR